MQDPETLSKQQLLELLSKKESVLAAKDDQLTTKDKQLLVKTDTIKQLEAKIQAQEKAYLQLWQERFAALDRPLIAMLVGGETNPFIMNRQVAEDLVATAHWVVDDLGGTPYVTTSRRTNPEVIEVLREGLPPEAVFYQWSADSQDNPYRALLGSADGFIVTADSVSMMVEVIYLHKPLAIFPLPGGWLGSIDQKRRSLAHWLFNPRQTSSRDRLRHRIARGVYYLDYFKILCATRDFRAFHRLLVEQGLAVWSGEPFRNPEARLPDDVGAVVKRIEALFP